MISTKELFDSIGSGDTLLYRDVPDFDADEFVGLLGQRLVQTGGQDYALAVHKEDRTDHSNRTDYFDWHSDGLYHAWPPRFVLLHCVDPGDGTCQTDFVSVAEVLAWMRPEAIETLRKLRSWYIGHGGNFGHPILVGNDMLLASRGHVDALPTVAFQDQPSIREITDAMSNLYSCMDDCETWRRWSAGLTVVFDQRKFMHRRISKAIDRKRKLIRMWFN
jgi:alpha-ketoglutarate-dependent taurine dioxygenase